MMIINFIEWTLALLIVVLFALFRTPRNVYNFLKNQKSIVKGILIVLILIPLIAEIAELAVNHAKADEPTTTYYNNAFVYTGLDFGKKQLPNCEQGENDNITSNVGFGINLVETQRTTINAKYTHHSCAFQHDYWSYDAVGVEIKYTIPLK